MRRTAMVCVVSVAAACAIAGCSDEGSNMTPGGIIGASGMSGGSAAPIGGDGTTGVMPGVAGTSAGGAPANPGVAGTGTAVAGAGGTATVGGDAAAGMDPNAMSDGGAMMEPETCDKDLTPMPGQDECSAPLKPGDDRRCMRMIGGQMREFYLYASPAFNPCQPATMIMDCHGLSESIEVHTGKEGFNLSGQMFPSGNGSGWRMAVQKDNAIVVTPAGIGQSWTVSSDVPFVNELADFVETTAEVDPEHVYVTGISMGGMMTVATGCDDANRWRGMSPVAMLQQSCAQLAKPTPVISFHAEGDQLTNYGADRTLMQRIADFNHCMAGPTASASYGGANSSTDAVCYVTPNGVGDPDAPDPLAIPLQPCPSSAPATECVTWSQCDDGVEVTFCTVNADSQPIGGHILYNNDTQLDLAEVAWPFFKKFWK